MDLLSQDQLILNESRIKLFKVFLIGITMTGLCFFLTLVPAILPKVVGWFGLAFFGLCTLAIFFRFLRAGAKIIIDHQGIDDHLTGYGLIAWDEITCLQIKVVESTPFLCVEVLDPQKYLLRLPPHKKSVAKMNTSFGFSPITLNFTGLDADLDQICRFIQKFKPIQGQQEPPENSEKLAI